MHPSNRNRPKPEKSAWSIPPKNADKDPSSNPEQKFREAQLKLQEAVQKYAKDYESSSSEDELESENVIELILKKYNSVGGKTGGLGRTQVFLEESFLSGAATCLICIASVKRVEKIWNCAKCFNAFHLTCIERWSKDSVSQQKQALIEQNQDVKSARITWGCPKCRCEYNQNEIPRDYKCFCGKTTDPEYQHWLVPHSCGNTCEKPLQPHCGHECTLLCHPGPCPPCPKSVKTACYCGAKLPRIQRCSNKEWSCDLRCSKILSCGKHPCGKNCHPGECPPCLKKSQQKCFCGNETTQRDCAAPTWHCKKLCHHPLSCGNHKCPIVCHSGECEDCVLSKPRSCPCGKTLFELPCTQETPTCGDTCGKLLECGMHNCNQRCHKDNCGDCLEFVTKYCRCGLHSKEILCKKQYLCDTKCKQPRDCMKHACNRKCCDGNCPPCEKPCGRTLSCGVHKCSSVCHRGPCYPCTLTNVNKCRCGETKLVVPCGRKSKKRPPKCIRACKILPDCHHKKRDPHHCHFGPCPPCQQICGKTHLNCTHLCPDICHSSVLVKVEVPKGTWKTGHQNEKVCLPCTPCQVPVEVTCLGKHETWMWPCHDLRKMSCEKPCGRLLPCGNHTCIKICHEILVSEINPEVMSDCSPCEGICDKPRPDGCTHSCLDLCHPNKCQPCQFMLRQKCLCGLNQSFVKCWEWTSSSQELKEKMLNCGNRCPKIMECGHRCMFDCHQGPCSSSNLCKKKIKINCDCKRVKKEFSCHLITSGQATISCDDICEKNKLETEKLKEQKKQERIKAEQEKNEKEYKEFQKKFSKKKCKDRRRNTEIIEDSFLKKHFYKILLFFSVMIIIISISLYSKF